MKHTVYRVNTSSAPIRNELRATFMDFDDACEYAEQRANAQGLTYYILSRATDGYYDVSAWFRPVMSAELRATESSQAGEVRAKTETTHSNLGDSGLAETNFTDDVTAPSSAAFVTAPSSRRSFVCSVEVA